MEQFIQQLINGLSIGSVYAMVALGYTMVYGIMKLINFAHGDILMVGSYVGFFCAQLGLPFLATLLISVAFCCLLGVVVEKLAYRPLRNAPRITLLITAIGVSFLLEYIVMYIAKPDARSYPIIYLSDKSLSLGPIDVRLDRIYVILITLIVMVSLHLFIKNTKMGRAMRSVSSDRDAALLMGVNVDKTISFTFLLGSGLAGVAGVLYGAIYQITPLMGMQPGLKAFTAAVLGGIGNIPGAMLGSMLLGFIETMFSGYISSEFKDAAAFAILIIVLIVKPTGLLGKNVGEKV